MPTKVLLEYSQFATLFLTIAVLVAMCWRKALRTYAFVGLFLASDALNQVIQIPLLFFRKELGIGREMAFSVFFYSHLIIFAFQSFLMIAIIYQLFRHAMKPLVGLHDIGEVIFRWVFGVSVAVSLAFALGPHMLLRGVSASLQFANIDGHIQQGMSVLAICLLLFVTVAIKPLGLTLRSHVFGVTLGLGIFAMVQLVEGAWLATQQAHSVYSPVFLFGTVGGCVTYMMWGLYFAVPEPERGMVLLPTTSPYFRWNRISEALGDAPGNVVIAGFLPSMMHPAELQMFTAPSKRPVPADPEPEMAPAEAAWVGDSGPWQPQAEPVMQQARSGRR